MQQMPKAPSFWWLTHTHSHSGKQNLFTKFITKEHCFCTEREREMKIKRELKRKRECGGKRTRESVADQ